MFVLLFMLFHVIFHVGLPAGRRRRKMSTYRKRPRNTVSRVSPTGTAKGRRGPRGIAQADKRPREHH